MYQQTWRFCHQLMLVLSNHVDTTVQYNVYHGCWENISLLAHYEPTHYGCLPIVGVSLPFRWFATHQYGSIPNMCLFQRGYRASIILGAAKAWSISFFHSSSACFSGHGSVSPESKCRGLLCIAFPSTHLNKLWGRPWMGLKWAKHAQSFSRSTQQGS